MVDLLTFDNAEPLSTVLIIRFVLFYLALPAIRNISIRS